ncbi:PASTA domain-containing protein, partial [Edaphobacter aggregans]|uniref:PASTA domain-containing protein n=1 Tax=Edaphobacter aggregans TaxID=570835 RepID=UPI000553D674
MRVRVQLVGWGMVRRFFNIVLGAMAMVAVALISAFVAMRLAIHGREVKVPDLTHMTISEASRKASSMGLRLQLENRFYSPDTPAGQVLAQYPVAGVTVRRQWPVRVTESLGSQRVSIPDLTGQGERSVAIKLKQLGLELGAVGHIAAPRPEGAVVAQTPPPNAQGVDRPRVSVLLSEAEEDSEDSDDGVVMPSLVGLTVSSAYVRAGAAGLRIVSAEDVTPTADATGAVPAAAAGGGAAAPAGAAAAAGQVGPVAPAAAAGLAPGIVAAQSPLAGHRVSRGDSVRLSLMH